MFIEKMSYLWAIRIFKGGCEMDKTQWVVFVKKMLCKSWIKNSFWKWFMRIQVSPYESVIIPYFCQNDVQCFPKTNTILEMFLNSLVRTTNAYKYIKHIFWRYIIHRWCLLYHFDSETKKNESLQSYYYTKTQWNQWKNNHTSMTISNR